MNQPNDNALQLGVAVYLAKSYGEDERDFLESAALMLERALPDATNIERGGAFWSKIRPVKTLKVTLGELEFSLANRDKSAPLEAQIRRSVRGVALKTESVSMADWIARLSASLSERAAQSHAAREALEAWLG